jgi:hypothetical protein
MQKMHKTSRSSIGEILKEFRMGILAAIAALIVAGGLAFLKSVRTLVCDTLNIQTTIGLLLLSSALFYFLGRQIEKQKYIKKTKENYRVVHHYFFKYDSLKWDVTIYADDHFKVDPLPFCAKHEMRLVEYELMYHCPRFDECNSQIDSIHLEPAKAEVESHIEAELRRRNKHT